jgi:N6-adenosine-specific RNA methylase IME4
VTQLLKYEAACLALAECHSVDEAKGIHEKAEAMRVYAIQAKNVDLEMMAAEIRVRAERRLGELLIEAKKDGRFSRGQPKKNCQDDGQFSRIQLDDIGVDRNLSSRAQKIASVSEPAFEAAIARVRQRIRDGGKVSLDISAATKQERRASREAELGAKQCALPQQKFGVVVADPEWRFEPWSRTTGMDRASDNHYPTSCTDVIAARGVPSIAADDCVLFLWATVPMLPHALAVMAAWGFTYKSSFTWIKDKLGTGYWNRNNIEYLLIGTRGHIPAPAPGQQHPAGITAPVGAHSAKPDIFLDIIEQYFPTLPKIELNRRGVARPGWSAWGNELAFRAPTDAGGAPLKHDEHGEVIETTTHGNESGSRLDVCRRSLALEEFPDLPEFLRRGPDGLAPWQRDRAIMQSPAVPGSRKVIS